MHRSELLEMIAVGENSGVEFEQDDLRPEQLAKEAVAFANCHGGHILLGVDDDGTILGIQRDNLERWVMDTVFGRYVHPVIIPFYEEVPIDDKKRVGVITITQGATKPYVVRKGDREDIYIRSGSISRLATREQQGRLHAQGGILQTECLPVSGSSLEDLSRDRLADYLLHVIGEKNLPSSDEEWCNHLCLLSFMVEMGNGPPVCTIAGLILFGDAPRRLLRYAGVRWMAFSGGEKSYDALDDRTVDSPLVPHWKQNGNGQRVFINGGLIDLLISTMQPFASKESVDVRVSLRRERKWFYPETVLREALGNALGHRDWTRHEETEAVLYSDRFEVLSPGALHNSMTVEKMFAGRRSSRNPLIVEVLRDYGYVDARGMGIRNKIVPLLQVENQTQPEFFPTEDYVKLVMYAKRGSQTPEQ